MDLKDKVAIVTGGAQGIGYAIAGKLLCAGACVVIGDINLPYAEKAARELSKSANESADEDIAGCLLDVTDIKSCESFVARTIDKFGRIDILVNNAGITKDNLVIRMSDDEWDKVLAVNLKGSFNMIHACARQMMKQRYGKIVNISSIIGIMGNPGQANYASSKGGLIALTKSCAREFASRNITVNAIAPGFIKTRMTDALSDMQKQELAKQIPLGRIGLPEDVANLCLFLASSESDYVTGEVIRVDGGMAI
jgi:3-oxoacyl-[acyl-carrier protein] reductase